MTRLLSILAFLLAALLAPAAQAQESWTGDWHGTLATPRGELRLVLTVRAGEGGALAAELESPDQAPGRKIPVTGFAIADGRMRFAIPAIGASYEGAWRQETARFSGTFTQGAALPLDLERGPAAARPTIAGLDGIWEGSVTRNGTPLRLILRVITTAGGTVAALDSPDMLAMGLPVAGLAREGETVTFAVPAGASRYRGILAPGGARMTGTWSRAGSPDAEVAFVRRAPGTAAQAPARPQMPRAPFPYRTEEVRFPNSGASGVTLAGTLSLPEGRGPFPAAILITGSGGQDRDETIFGHKPFAVLADHLTRNGIAVLRYDDRGIGASTGTQAGATSADFATDANAAFAYLGGRPEIDRRAIGFIGHSEGGMIGPIAAMDNPDVAWLVLLAAPGVAIPRLMAAQARAIGSAQGMSAAQQEQSVAAQQALFAAAALDGDAAAVAARLEAAGVPPGQSTLLAAQARDPWLRYFVRYDPAPALARIHVPLLALNGALDRQVLPRENLAGIRAATAANRDVTIRELPGLNHLFQTARTGAAGEYADIEETFAPAAVELVTNWIRARFVRR
jgi:dienelactone hydrolase